MDDDLITIDEGATYEYLVHGLTVLIIGFILSVFHWIALIIPIVGIALMASKTGIIVDRKQLKIKKYKTFFSYKFGD